MRIWFNKKTDTERKFVDFTRSPVAVGSGKDCDLVLDSPFVAARAAIFNVDPEGNWSITAHGMNGCKVNGTDLSFGAVKPLQGGEVVDLFPFTLTVELPSRAKQTALEQRLELEQRMFDLIKQVHREVLRRLHETGQLDAPDRESDQKVLMVEQHVEDIARIGGALGPDNRPLVDHMAGYCLRGIVLTEVSEDTGATLAQGLRAGGAWSRLRSANPDREREVHAAAGALRQVMKVPRPKEPPSEAARGTPEAREEARKQRIRVEKFYWTAWEHLAPRLSEELKQYLALRLLWKELKDIMYGYGPLEDLIRAPSITEIMVVSSEQIFVERDGVLESSHRRFVSDDVTLHIIDKIVRQVDRRLDKSQPLVDARLPDGSRVNAIIPPLAVSGPCLTIRKFALKRLTIDELLVRGSLTAGVAEFLRAAVLSRRNLLIAGGTGTGKTTLLNCLSNFIPDNERIVTVEDTAELQLQKQHVVRLEAREANVEGAGAYRIRDLVRNALRMRPDRIVVGECRGPEALDMLQAMNTGHDGSLTTIHANSPSDVILRLEVLVQMEADLPVSSIRRQVASALDLFVQIMRRPDGSRVISGLTEVVRYDQDSDSVILKDLFVREGDHGEGVLRPTGRLPTFIDDLLRTGAMPLEAFYP